jgi:uncharacterized RDD family membrane protein YckC
LLLDTTYDIATPEGVELQLSAAGLAPRALAWLIDAAVKGVALMAAGALLAAFGDFGQGLYLLAAFLLLWFYNVLFEVLNHGATPGKRYMGLSVMNVNGTPVGWSGSLTRNLIRVVDTLPGCYAFGCICVLVTRKFQRLGDLAAGTVVVHRPRERQPVPDGGVAARPLTVPLSLEEQQAIVDFRERTAGLNADRAEELAALLKPVLGDVDANRLLGYAGWLAGRKHTG